MSTAASLTYKTGERAGRFVSWLADTDAIWCTVELPASFGIQLLAHVVQHAAASVVQHEAALFSITL